MRNENFSKLDISKPYKAEGPGERGKGMNTLKFSGMLVMSIGLLMLPVFGTTDKLAIRLLLIGIFTAIFGTGLGLFLFGKRNDRSKKFLTAELCKAAEEGQVTEGKVAFIERPPFCAILHYSFFDYYGEERKGEITMQTKKAVKLQTQHNITILFTDYVSYILMEFSLLDKS